LSLTSLGMPTITPAPLPGRLPDLGRTFGSAYPASLRASVRSRARAVLASSIRPARASATAASNGRRTTSMPSSGARSGSAPVRARNRCTRSLEDPGDVWKVASGSSEACRNPRRAARRVLAFDVEQSGRDLLDRPAGTRPELTDQEDVTVRCQRQDRCGVLRPDHLPGPDAGPFLLVDPDPVPAEDGPRPRWLGQRLSRR
jgi:hypothetical protein